MGHLSISPRILQTSVITLFNTHKELHIFPVAINCQALIKAQVTYEMLAHTTSGQTSWSCPCRKHVSLSHSDDM